MPTTAIDTTTYDAIRTLQEAAKNWAEFLEGSPQEAHTMQDIEDIDDALLVTAGFLRDLLDTGADTL